MLFLIKAFFSRVSCVVVTAILFLMPLFGQEIPPVQFFTPQDYKADDQNWSISQGEDKIIYVGNNKGLLEFNGARWKLNKTPNQSIVRSVSVIDSLIYTGSYMDFGFWKRNQFGILEYNSIINKLKEDLIEDEEFWNIIAYNQFVLFQSLDRIYIYNRNNETFRIINSKNGITKIFKVGNSIYFQELGLGIFKIQNGASELFSSDVIVRDNKIINIFKADNNLLFQTKENGFFLLQDGLFQKWNISANNQLSEVSVYNGIRLRNDNFIIGTISNGVLELDADGNLLFQINKKNGLLNNTVLSAFQDVSGNIWLGLDNGVAVLNLNSPYRVYNDLQGNLGTVYASAKTEEYLYLGTNQGLFYKLLGSKNDFTLMPNTKGQVWFLKQIGDTLFCGHDNGTFQISDASAYQIFAEKGTWNIKEVEGNPNLLLTGNYDGLNVLQKGVNGNWFLKNQIEGFDISSRYFEFLNKKQIIISHEHKGVFILDLNEDLTKINQLRKIDVGKSIGASLVRFNNEILYAFKEGVFKYDAVNSRFDKSDLLSEYFKKSNYISGKFILDEENNRLWNFFNNQITYIESGKLTNTPIVKSIDITNELRKSKQLYENITHYYNDTYLLGTTNGYLLIDISKPFSQEFSISINNGLYSEQLNEETHIDFDSNLYLKNNQNNLSFEYSISSYSKFLPVLYQYRLQGIYDNWSDWSSESSTFFENLPEGDYTFEVRGKVGNNTTDNKASFSFTIQRPWFLKPIAIFGYIIVFLIIAVLVQYLNRIYYKKQQQNIIKAKEKELEIKELETQKQIMAFKNETLQQDIENKNRELGLSTMTLIRKNEFLNTLKKELNTLEKTKELNKIIKIIDKNINNNEDWKFFEEAFNNADKDFLKKIKKRHPSLTPNDLKLCAYLRLNLSSKEIAPLLNISHRSVEVKRYRLRKKIQLAHEASLTNYILDI